MRLAAGDRLGSYEIVGTLGAGGMGEVYRARDTRLGREVAIKVLPAEKLSDPARRARFEQEARAVAALNHPHIVTIHEIESAEGVDFIVMELVAGKTLDALIPPSRDAASARCCGSRSRSRMRSPPLTRAGIVHRDLKPANVMVTPEGVVKVLDFGLAKLTQAETASSEDDTTLDAQAKLSRPGTVAGTPAYMSPEQASGRPVDARSDVFSFGALLYEMVTGRRPFAGRLDRRDARGSPEGAAAGRRARSCRTCRGAGADHPAVPEEGAGAALPARAGREGRAAGGQGGVGLGGRGPCASSGRQEACGVGCGRPCGAADRVRHSSLALAESRRSANAAACRATDRPAGRRDLRDVLAGRPAGGVLVERREGGQPGHLREDDRLLGAAPSHDRPGPGLRPGLVSRRTPHRLRAAAGHPPRFRRSEARTGR